MNPSEEKKIIVITRAFGAKHRNEYDDDHLFNTYAAEDVLKEGTLKEFLVSKGAGEKSVFLHYKKITGKEIYLLPCYKEEYEEPGLSYVPLHHREELLPAIIAQFDLQANRLNELYIHDTEWGSPYYDYNALTEVGGEKKEMIHPYFSGIYVFAHSPVSEYYQKILVKELKDYDLRAINFKREALISIESLSTNIPDPPADFQFSGRPETLEEIAQYTYHLLKMKP